MAQATPISLVLTTVMSLVLPLSTLCIPLCFCIFPMSHTGQGSLHSLFHSHLAYFNHKARTRCFLGNRGSQPSHLVNITSSKYQLEVECCYRIWDSVGTQRVEDQMFKGLAPAMSQIAPVLIKWSFQLTVKHF